MIKEHEADYIGIASRNWKAIEKEIINQALPNTSIIYAFFCRKSRYRIIIVKKKEKGSLKHNEKLY